MTKLAGTCLDISGPRCPCLQTCRLTHSTAGHRDHPRHGISDVLDTLETYRLMLDSLETYRFMLDMTGHGLAKPIYPSTPDMQGLRSMLASDSLKTPVFTQDLS